MTFTSDINLNYPISITLTGIDYNQSKTLSLRELSLFIERDIKYNLTNDFGQTVNVEVREASDSNFKNPKLFISIDSLSDTDVQFLLHDIRNIVNSYNKIVLMEDQGEIKSVYRRFTYDIHSKRNPSKPLFLVA